MEGSSDLKESPFEDPEETAHFKQVVSAFFNYSVDAMRDIARMERDFAKIDERYMKYLSSRDVGKTRIERLKKAVLQNAQVLNRIVAEYQGMFELDKLPGGMVAFKPMYIKPTDVVKMRSTIKSFLRDWSSEGQAERDMCYKPIMDEVESYFPNPVDPVTGKRVSVLHPGCGMGRLVFDFALRGFKSQGNEFTYFMLLASNFILNYTDRCEQYEVYPFVHCFSNLKTEE